MKSIYKSKTVWFNLILMLIEVATFFEGMVSPDLLPYLVAIQGVGNIVLRIWFSNTAITLKNGSIE